MHSKHTKFYQTKFYQIRLHSVSFVIYLLLTNRFSEICTIGRDLSQEKEIKISLLKN